MFAYVYPLLGVFWSMLIFSSADQIAKFAALRDQGVITEAEFAAQKAQLLT